MGPGDRREETRKDGGWVRNTISIEKRKGKI
jgi:hypothetical protein